MNLLGNRVELGGRDVAEYVRREKVHDVAAYALVPVDFVVDVILADVFATDLQVSSVCHRIKQIK